MKYKEPPHVEPHIWWRKRTANQLIVSFLLDFLQLILKKKNLTNDSFVIVNNLTILRDSRTYPCALHYKGKTNKRDKVYTLGL